MSERTIPIAVSTGSTGVSTGSTGVSTGSTGVASGSTGVSTGSTGVASGPTGVASGSTGVASGPTGDLFAGHGPGRVRSADELKALAEEASVRLADATAEEVAAWAAGTFGRNLAVACSMAGDTVVPHLVSRFAPGVDVLFLQTGYHFAETIGTRDALAISADVTIVDVLPRQTVAEQDATHGEKLYARDPALCCALRKVEPIERELATYEAWVTGVRREDNALRAHTRLVEWDERHQMVKINPIAAWTFDELLDYAGRHGVPVNLLLSDGYPSIGCEPCTRRVEPGEDPRAGRWAGLAKTECGLHT